MLDRPSLLTLKGQTNLVGCEVGVEGGDNAFSIFTDLDIQMLYLIDPYPPYFGLSGDLWEYSDSVDAFSEWKSTIAKEVAHERLSDFEDKIIWIEKKSCDAYRDIPDNSLDFVYIDGDHKYSTIKRDLELFYPKVKIEGLFAGHDYGNPCGVGRAVKEFCENHKIEHLQTEEMDWWIIRGETC